MYAERVHRFGCVMGVGGVLAMCSMAHAGDSLQFVPQTAHGSEVTSLSWSHDGRFAVSADILGTAMLWDIRHGTLIKAFRPGDRKKTVPEPSAFAGAFRSNKEAVFMLDSAFRTLNLTDGSTVGGPRVERASARQLAMSNGSPLLWSLGTLQMIDARTGATVWSASAAESAPVFAPFLVSAGALAVSPDGKIVATSSGEGISVFYLPEQKPTMWDKSVGASCLSISATGKLLASTAPDEKVRIYDLETKKVRLTLPAKDVKCAYISPQDDKVAFVGAHFTIYDVTTSRLLVDVPLRQESKLGAWSSDGKQLLVAEGGTIALFDTRGRRTAALPAPAAQPDAVAISPDGKTAVIGDHNGDVAVWNLETLSLKRVAHAHSGFIRDIGFSTANEVVSGGRDERVVQLSTSTGVVRESPTGKKVSELILGTDDISIVFGASSDGKWAASGGRQEVTIYALGTGGPKKSGQIPVDRPASVAFGDGLLVVGNDGGEVRAYDPATRSERWALKVAKDRVVHQLVPTSTGTFARLSWFGQYSATKDESESFGEIVKFDNRTGRLLSRFSERGFVVAGAVLSASANGERIAVAGLNGEIHVYDGRGAKKRTLADGRGAYCTSLAMSPSGKHLLGGFTDGAARLFDLDTGASVALVTDGAEWAAYTPEGYFDASRDGGHLVAAVGGMQGFRVDRLAARNNRPDLVLSGVSVGSTALIESFRRRHEQRLKRMGLREAQLAESFATLPIAEIVAVTQNGRTARIQTKLSGRGAPLTGYQLFVNNVPVFGSVVKEAHGTAASTEDEVPLISGSNLIEIEALNAAGGRSLRDFRLLEASSVPSKIHFIGFGVSHYKDSRLNLAYAHKDALELGYAFRKAAERVGGSVHVFTDDRVTTASILDAKRLLANVSPDDIVVLFVAGHGTHGRSGDVYYYLTHDTDVSRLSETAAEFALFENLLVSTPARRRLFLLDTCESGERDDVDETKATTTQGHSRRTRGLVLSESPAILRTARPGPATSFERDRFIDNDLVRRTGAIVLSSSTGNEASFEFDSMKNGVFTHVLLQALSDSAADTDRNGQISSGELRSFVTKGVAKRTDDLQHPRTDRDNLAISISLPLLAGMTVPPNLQLSDVEFDSSLPAQSAKQKASTLPPRNGACACDVVGREQESAHTFLAPSAMALALLAAFARKRVHG